jgi:hypothetical protein
MDDLSQFASLDNLLALATQHQNQMVPYQAPVYPQPVPYIQMLHPQPQYQPPLQQPVDTTPYVHKPITDKEIPLFGQLIRNTESHGNYQAKNPNTTASGAYQYVNGTWNNYGGYPEARLAPRQVQDAKFNEDALTKLHRFNGDLYQMIADHMLPTQARSPELWTHPSVQMNRGKPLRVPPVADYIRKVVKGTPYQQQFEAYLRAHGAES